VPIAVVGDSEGSTLTVARLLAVPRRPVSGTRSWGERKGDAVRTELIVGRDGQLAVLDAVVDTLSGGPARAAVIVGEAGTGRSTVWQYAVQRASGLGYQVLSCRPGEPAPQPSFAGLIELLDDTDKVDRLPVPQRRVLEVALLRADHPNCAPVPQTVGVAVLTLFRELAAARPLLVAVDDTNLLDPETAAVLRYLARRLHDEQVGLLATYCGLDADERDPLDLRDGFEDDALHRIRLGPLAPAEVRRLVELRTGVRLTRPDLLRVYRVSNGNPSVALQLAGALAASDVSNVGRPLPVPPHWVELADARTAELPPVSRAALLYAAALDHPTSDLVRSALGADGPLTPGLVEAEQAGLVTTEDGLVRFTEPMLGLAVYWAAGGEQRRAAHLRLSEVAPDPERHGLHRALANDAPDASVADAADRAARAAQERGAMDMAADLWTLASQHTPVADMRRGRRVVAAGRCLFRAGDGDRAREVLEAAAEATPAGPDRARALLWLAAVVNHRDGPKPAVALLRQAVPLAEQDPWLTAQLQLRLAWFADDLPVRLAAADTARACLDRTDAPTTPRWCADVTNAYLRFLAGKGLDRALSTGEAEPLPDAGSSDDAEHGRAIVNLVAELHDPALAWAGWHTALEHARRAGDEPAATRALYHLSQVECWLGDWPSAQHHVNELLDAVEQSGHRRCLVLALHAQALVAAHVGDGEAASVAIDQGLKLAELIDDPAAGALHLSVRGFLDLSRGDPNAAELHLAHANELVARTGVIEPHCFNLAGNQIEAAVATGALPRAADLLAQLRNRVRVSPYPRLLMTYARSRAVVAMAHGNLDEAAAGIQDAYAVHQQLPGPFELARTQLVHGQVLRRLRRRRAAEQALRQAAKAFVDLGATLWSQHADAELGRLGTHRGGDGQLTPTERQVARLVVDGYTNPRVASALRISRRTVENHLGRIYRKLGVGSRTELAAQFGRAVGQT
jgi:DNA-binding CsgD family transcriptional regulator